MKETNEFYMEDFRVDTSSDGEVTEEERASSNVRETKKKEK